MKYEKLFQPGKIGNLELRNRVVMTAMGNGLAAENGEASDEIIACYKARAAGGCGLLITEFCAVDGENGIAETHQLQIHAPRFIKRLALLTDTADTIQSISQKVGYSDVRSYIRFFKKYYDATPSEYRRGAVGK